MKHFDLPVGSLEITLLPFWSTNLHPPFYRFVSVHFTVILLLCCIFLSACYIVPYIQKSMTTFFKSMWHNTGSFSSDSNGYVLSCLFQTMFQKPRLSQFVICEAELLSSSDAVGWFGCHLWLVAYFGCEFLSPSTAFVVTTFDTRG